MRRKWFQGWFDAPTTASERKLPDLSRYDMGVCPGCRGLRAVTSPRCSHCGSTKPVTADV